MVRARTCCGWALVSALVLFGWVSSVAAQVPGVILRVTSTADEVDSNPSDSLCQTASGKCTLRAAIQHANAHRAVPYEIRLPEGSYALTASGMWEDAAQSGDLDIRSSLSIVGAGRRDYTVIDASTLATAMDPETNATWPDRVVEMHRGSGNVSLSNLTIRGGNLGCTSTTGACSAWSGAGIQQVGGTLVVRNVAVLDNLVHNLELDYGFGAGISSSGTLIVENSWIANNRLYDETYDCSRLLAIGGGIYHAGSTGADRLEIRQSQLEGNAACQGGGVGTQSTDNLLVRDSLVSQNFAGNWFLRGEAVGEVAQGGGIYVGGGGGTPTRVAIERVQIDSNESMGEGGGLYNFATSSIISQSTLSRNHTPFGQGNAVSFVYDTVQLENSTISNNQNSTGQTCPSCTASGAVMVIGAYGVDWGGSSAVLFLNSTIAQNSGLEGKSGALLLLQADSDPSDAVRATVKFANSIVAENAEPQCQTLGRGLVLESQGNNLTTDESCGLDASSDLIVESAELGPLQDNGGGTETHALLADSPAIDAIVSEEQACPATDQRGVERPVDGDDDDRAYCDIGSYEYGVEIQ